MTVWHVVTTAPQGEFAAERELNAAGLQTMLPSYSRVSQHSKRRVERQEPHMRRYIAVAADCETVLWRECKKAKHAQRPLGRLRKGEATRVEEMANIDMAAPADAPGRGFKAGQIVRIAEGPFIGLSGPIAYVGSDVAKVELQLFGRITEIPVDFSVIEACAS